MAIAFRTGLTPVQTGGAGASNFKTTVYQASLGTTIYTGTPVGMNASGKIIPMASAGDGEFLGAATGFFYIADTGPLEAQYIANVSSRPGNYNGVNFTHYAGAAVKVSDDPNQLYVIKATASLSIGSLVQAYDFTSADAGNATYGGQSDAKLNATGVSAGAIASAGLLTVIQPYAVDEYVERTSTSGGHFANWWDSPETVVVVKPRIHRDRPRS